LPEISPSISAEGSFTTVEHTADWAITVLAPDLRQLFIVAANGMNSFLLEDPELLSLAVKKRFNLSGIDAESLLVEWLSELAFWAETERLIFKSFEIHKIDANYLEADVVGDIVPSIEKHIKAVTYHDLKIVATDSGLEATIVFDV
jgi:SHS2 domain-containing protein